MWHEERATKQSVATKAKDARFTRDVLLSAPVVFADNDIKYEVDKCCPQAYAARQDVGIVFCPAKDTPSAEDLRARPDLPAQKLNWLQRHDRESGDLYGMLPIIVGMTVAMSDHIDRIVDKRFYMYELVVFIHGFSQTKNSSVEEGSRILQYLPKVVFVKSHDKCEH